MGEMQPEREPEIPPAALQEILNQIQGIDAGADGVIAAMAEMHAKWYRAWVDTGAFDADHAFELVRIIVASSAGALRSLA